MKTLLRFVVGTAVVLLLGHVLAPYARFMVIAFTVGGLLLLLAGVATLLSKP